MNTTIMITPTINKNEKGKSMINGFFQNRPQANGLSGLQH
jgi:hypothetical protein